MTTVHWNPYLSIGHDGIDAEHQDLVKVLNDLITRIEDGAELGEVRDGLGRLIEETERHFRHEEAVMEREAYPEAEHHCHLHQALSTEIRAFDAELAGGKEMGPEITDFIRDWLIHHILKSDMRLGGYLEGRESGWRLRNRPAGRKPRWRNRCP